jgi:hypothetical protein
VEAEEPPREGDPPPELAALVAEAVQSILGRGPANHG